MITHLQNEQIHHLPHINRAKEVMSFKFYSDVNAKEFKFSINPYYLYILQLVDYLNRIQDYITEMENIEVNEVEYAYLKLISLFNTGKYFIKVLFLNRTALNLCPIFR